MTPRRAFDRRVLVAVGTLALAASFLLCGYEFARSASMSLFIDVYGSARLPYAMTAVPVVLALLIYCYGRALSAWGPMRTVVGSTLFSAAVFLGCYAALKTGSRSAAAVLYVYREAYIVIIIEQYWSLINSTLKPEEAKVINGPIVGCASLGPILGGFLVRSLAEPLGTEQFVLLAAASLLPAALLSGVAYTLAGEPRPAETEGKAPQGHVNLGLFFRNRNLLLLALVVGITQIVSTALSLRFYGLVEASIPLKDARTAYLGGFWFATNCAASFLQFVATPIVLRWVPLRWVHVGMPAIHLVACAVLLAHPVLAAGAAAFLIFKSFDYSLFRAAKEVLYIPLSYDARYRAKQVIDSFAYRFSKGATGGAFSAAAALAGAVPGPVYVVLAWLAALVWAGVAFPLTGRRFTKDLPARNSA